ncbi:MAG: 4-alpha-glucanotransferase [Prevotella sp.]|nr:4-alpha-glucanotransferase [Prevotella sp.]
MKLRFTISYDTVWGQSLHVVITYLSADRHRSEHNLSMHTRDGSLWTLETSVIESRQHPVSGICYHYQVEDQDGRVMRREWDLNPRIYPFDSSKDYFFPDRWRDLPLPYHLYTAAYAVTGGYPCDDRPRFDAVPLFRQTVIFRVSAPQLQEGECLGLCGNHPALGDWNPSRFLKMHDIGNREWMLSVNIYGVNRTLEYKYVIVDAATGELKAWEEGANRTSGDAEVGDGQVLVLYGEELRVKDPLWRCAGVVVPVFALRSDHSYGVGDFGDLKRFVDWASVAGMKAIQLLPVHDTSTARCGAEANPYNVLSAFALHPHYLDLDQMGELKDPDRRNAFHRRRRELNALTYTDYEAVETVKMALVDELFGQDGPQLLSSRAYAAFREANEAWLGPYADFVADEKMTKEKVGYIQYHLHCQLKAAADYARSKGIFLIGDLPVGVAVSGVDVSTHPECFDTELRMGTLPDTDHLSGQIWGFPVARELSAPAIAWWQARLAHEACYFDAMRIDHAAGYFRTWAIPVGVTDGHLGHFTPSFPLSASEIEHAGLTFRKEFLTKPFINDGIVDSVFGVHAAFVRENCLVKKAYGLYDLKAGYDTQVKISHHFDGKGDENSRWIRDGLLQLVANVMFMEDPDQPEMYHPRFAAYRTAVFDTMPSADKEAFMKLYNNYFYERNNQLWANHARHLLTTLFGMSRLLLYAEDLGEMPPGSASVLESMRILSLEVQTCPKSAGSEFAHLEANPPRSVATVSTHDMPTLRQWWEENPGRTQRYYVSVLQKEGRAPEHLPAHLAEEIIARHLYCPSMLCLLSLQDWLSMDATLRAPGIREERINVPGDAFRQWRYRMHVKIEALMKADQFNHKLRTMIERSRR